MAELLGAWQGGTGGTKYKFEFSKLTTFLIQPYFG